MKRNVYVRFDLSQHLSAAEPLARFWLDRDRDGRIENDEEVRLEPSDGGLAFSGSTEQDEASLDGMAFRLNYLASTGARWTLLVTAPEDGQDGPDGAVLYKATDVVGTPKDWIMGGLTWKPEP